MKKVLGLFLLLILLTVNSFSETSEEEILQEATPFQIIEIMIEEGAVDEAEFMLNESKMVGKKSFEYYRLMAKIEDQRGNEKVALKFYEKASKKQPKNVFVKVAILKIKIQRNERAKVIRKEIKELLELDLSPDDRESIEAISKAYEEKKASSKSYMLNISTGLSYADNVYETNEDEKGDVFADTRLTGAFIKKFDSKLSLTTFGSVGNKTYVNEDSKNANNFFIGLETAKPVKNIVVAVPLTYNQSYEDGELSSSGYSVGLKGKRTLLKKIPFTAGIDFAGTISETEDSDSTSILLFSNINLIIGFGLIITPEVSYEFLLHDDEDSEYTGLAGKIAARWKFKEKHLLTASYKVTSKTYDEADREDLNHNVATNFESQIGKSKWKYILGYGMKMNDSDSSENEYTASTISFKIKREFN